MVIMRNVPVEIASKRIFEMFPSFNRTKCVRLAQAIVHSCGEANLNWLNNTELFANEDLRPEFARLFEFMSLLDPVNVAGSGKILGRDTDYLQWVAEPMPPAGSFSYSQGTASIRLGLDDISCVTLFMVFPGTQEASYFDGSSDDWDGIFTATGLVRKECIEEVYSLSSGRVGDYSQLPIWAGWISENGNFGQARDPKSMKDIASRLNAFSAKNASL